MGANKPVASFILFIFYAGFTPVPQSSGHASPVAAFCGLMRPRSVQEEANAE
jgi:hypothetical protein